MRITKSNELQRLSEEQPLSKNLYTKTCREALAAIGKVVLFYELGQKCSHPDCQERALRFLTVDHVMPIAVAYRLNWPWEKTAAIENLQLLCSKHHVIKDRHVKQLSIKAYNLQFEA